MIVTSSRFGFAIVVFILLYTCAAATNQHPLCVYTQLHVFKTHCIGYCSHDLSNYSLFMFAAACSKPSLHLSSQLHLLNNRFTYFCSCVLPDFVPLVFTIEPPKLISLCSQLRVLKTLSSDVLFCSFSILLAPYINIFRYRHG